MQSEPSPLRPMTPVAAGAAVLAALLLSGAPAPGAGPASAGGPPAASPPAAQETDTLSLPRARTAPALDCDVSEWPSEGRISLSRGEPGVVPGRGAGDAADLTARVHLSWTRDTMYVMADVRDDRVLPGGDDGDWMRVEVGGTAVWIPAPGGDVDAANTGTRAVGEELPTSICATEYGWLAEVAVPAGRLAGGLRLGDLVGLQVWAYDPDGGEIEEVPPYLRWSGVGVMSAAPAEETTADSVLAALREDVTMEELRARPGARDTAVELPGGETVPGVEVEVAGVPAVAFADPRAGGEVTYWLEGGPGSAVADLGLYRTVAALHRRLGELQAAEDRRPRAVYPEVRFELLPGVVFRLGEPGLTGDGGAVPRSALPTDVFVRAGGGG